ncbi:MAG: hypothetical protein NTX66_03730 [Candidatus Falkowbacteria bacterium]|nr:hypothetical protein [Candidatus Falkowbacteria bacterium]
MTDFKNKLNTSASSRPGRRLNLKVINMALFSLLIVFGLGYIVCINDLTVKGFALERLKNQANALASDNQEIESKMMAMQSYNNLINKVKDLNMVAVGEVDYLTVNNTMVAKK